MRHFFTPKIRIILILSVLLAIGLPHEIAHGSLRLSLSEENTLEQADQVVETLKEVVSKLRAMSPLYDEFLQENGAE